MRRDAIVIGGGQAGLAASYWLGARGIDHVILERGTIAERWRSSTWDSLYLQTPRWQSRLPGWSYAGPDPDGYMPVRELIEYLTGYARAIAAPVHDRCEVESVMRVGDGFAIHTSSGTWHTRTLIVATGHCDVPAIPSFANTMSPRVAQLAPARYRRPADLPAGGVLVVGASASGALLADELRAAGREVTLAVGNHTRVPRAHLGRDIYWWLDALGVLSESTHDTRDLEAARHQPSMQLAGDPRGRAVDLPSLEAAGVRLVGRVVGGTGTTLELADDLASTTAWADARARRIVERIDAFAAARGVLGRGPAARIAPIANTDAPRRLDLAAERIATVLWATGYRRDYRWLRVPGAVADGELVHDRGVTPVPGLYGLGLRYQRRRNSNFLDGVGDDARFVVEHAASRIEHRAPCAA